MSKKPLTAVQHKQQEIQYWQSKLDNSNGSTPKKHKARWRKIIKTLKDELSRLTHGGM